MEQLDLEVADKYNIGLDMSLLKGLTFSIDGFYDKRPNNVEQSNRRPATNAPVRRSDTKKEVNAPKRGQSIQKENESIRTGNARSKYGSADTDQPAFLLQLTVKYHGSCGKR